MRSDFSASSFTDGTASPVTVAMAAMLVSASSALRVARAAELDADSAAPRARCACSVTSSARVLTREEIPTIVWMPSFCWTAAAAMEWAALATCSREALICCEPAASCPAVVATSPASRSTWRRSSRSPSVIVRTASARVPTSSPAASASG